MKTKIDDAKNAGGSKYKEKILKTIEGYKSFLIKTSIVSTSTMAMEKERLLV